MDRYFLKIKDSTLIQRPQWQGYLKSSLDGVNRIYTDVSLEFLKSNSNCVTIQLYNHRGIHAGYVSRSNISNIFDIIVVSLDKKGLDEYG